MRRLSLAAVLGLGLAVAPAAQQATAPDDTDAPGATVVRSSEGLGIELFDDRDPMIRANGAAAPSTGLTTSTPALRADGVLSDTDDPLAPLAFPSAQGAYDAPLADGRDGVTPSLVVRAAPEIVDAMAAVGRTEASLAEAEARSPSPETAAAALDYGRPPGTRPGPVVEEEGALSPLAAPMLDAVEEAPSADGLALSIVQPNPVRSDAWVTVTLDAASSATVRVFDIQGREVALAFDGLVAAETPTRVQLDLGSVSAGTYVVVLEADGTRVSRTLQVVR